MTCFTSNDDIVMKKYHNHGWFDVIVTKEQINQNVNPRYFLPAHFLTLETKLHPPKIVKDDMNHLSHSCLLLFRYIKN